METSNPKQFWDNISNQPEWRDYVLPSRTDQEFDDEGVKEAEQIHRQVTKKFEVAIDYGCGIGRITKPFRIYCKRMIGLDICHKFIEIAKLRDKAEYYLTENFKEKNVADFVFSISVLQHNDKPNQIKIMNEIYGLLKPGGIAYITFASGDVYFESSFIHKFGTLEILELAKNFSKIEIRDGNLVRYGGSVIKPNQFNERILIATK